MAAETAPKAKTGRTTIATSRRFAEVVNVLAKEEGQKAEDFLDKDVLPKLLPRYAAVLRRKIAAADKNGAA